MALQSEFRDIQGYTKKLYQTKQTNKKSDTLRSPFQEKPTLHRKEVFGGRHTMRRNETQDPKHLESGSSSPSCTSQCHPTLFFPTSQSTQSSVFKLTSFRVVCFIKMTTWKFFFRSKEKRNRFSKCSRLLTNLAENSYVYLNHLEDNKPLSEPNNC